MANSTLFREKRGRTRWQLHDSNSCVAFKSGAARKQSASLPTNQLAIHRILLIRAGERDPTANHCPDYIDEPRQAPCKRERTSEPSTSHITWRKPRQDSQGVFFFALVPIYTKITQFSTWWKTGTTLLEKELQVCLEDFHYLKLFHCRKPLSCKNIFKHIQIPAGGVYSFKVHVAGGEVNIVLTTVHIKKKVLC